MTSLSQETESKEETSTTTTDINLLQPTFSRLVNLFQKYQRQRRTAQTNVRRLERSLLEKYERIAHSKSKLQYYQSWLDVSSSNENDIYPLALSDCYKLPFNVHRLSNEHQIHAFVRELRQSDIICTLIHNFQSYSHFYFFKPIVIKTMIEALFPAHSQLFNVLIQPLFTELLEIIHQITRQEKGDEREKEKETPQNANPNPKAVQITNDTNHNSSPIPISNNTGDMLKIGEDDETKIEFETANEIHFYADRKSVV
jgi:hypothetical protein